MLAAVVVLLVGEGSEVLLMILRVPQTDLELMVMFYKIILLLYFSCSFIFVGGFLDIILLLFLIYSLFLYLDICNLILYGMWLSFFFNL